MSGLGARGSARVDVLHAGSDPVLRQFLEDVAADPSTEAVNLGTAPEWSDRWHMDEAGLVELQVFRPTRRGRLVQAEVESDDGSADLRGDRC